MHKQSSALPISKPCNWGFHSTAMTGPEQKPPPEHAHQSPPESIRSLHKYYQKAPVEPLTSDPRVLDFTNLSEFHRNKLHVVGKLGGSRLQKIFDIFEAGAATVDGGQNIETEGASLNQETAGREDSGRLIYEHELLPGMSHSSLLRDLSILTNSSDQVCSLSPRFFPSLLKEHCCRGFG